KLFSDCTGDATVGFLAGADWHMGRESRSETGESLAPEKKDAMTMGASVQWNTVEDKTNNAFPELPWAIVFNEKTIRPMVHGDWDWEAGMNLDQINDTERIRDLGLRAAYGHWSYMKNKMTGPWAEKAKNLKLGWVSFYAGKRESRRLMGDVVLKQQNLVGRTQWDDACVTTTWPIDLHYPEEENAKNFPNETFRSVAKFVAIDQYAIPYRCLYSRNVENLFMAGRDISVTHVALGTIRVMRTGGMMGEVVGMAAAVARKNNCLPRGVYEKHLDELKAHMKEGIAPAPKAVQLLRRPKWLDKPGENFALKAKVSVSGILDSDGYAAYFINDGKADVKTNAGRWVSNQSEPSKANKNHWVTLTFDEPRTINAVHILSGMAINKPGKAPSSPISDFVLAYEKDGRFVDLPDTLVQDNQSSSIAIKFPAVKSKAFRLIIFNTPGNIARIWEIELFRVDD
ncbi:MAG: FAD-dependent oxidoreductase, partial [Planctomycetia bacterium]|nr:FAD-dependent oxidoreductase [Planctomycetia bacterium]